MPNLRRGMMAAAGAAGGATTSYGTLWGWGQNESGALGIGNTTNLSSPVQVGTNTNWSTYDLDDYGKCRCGGTGNSSNAVNEDGELFTWGYSEKGMGGRGDSVSVSSPVQIGSGTYWDTSTGGYDMWATTTTGQWWYLGGENNSGEGGQGNTTDYSSPVQIGSLTTWAKCGGTSATGFAIKTDGTLWAVGANSNGVLGRGDLAPGVSSPIQVGSDTTWKMIASAGNAAWALKTDGTIWAWGHNDEGQSGQGDTTNYCSPAQIGSLTTWALITADQRGSAFAIKTDGTLWAWGRNVEGQLGQGDTTVRSSPVQVGSLTDWKTVSGCAYSVAMTKTDGTLWTMGEGSYGNLGNGTTTSLSSPAQVGSDTDWISVGGQFGFHMYGIRTAT